MKKSYSFFYALMVLINIIPYIPMSVKGITGLVFIIISCVRMSYRDGLITATLWIICGFINFGLNINVDYKSGLITMLMGSVAYYIIAIFIGGSTEQLRSRNKELGEEIERRKRTERELKEKVTFLQSLMDTIPSPIFFKDLNYRYIGCNNAFTDSIGVSDSEIKGKTTYDVTDEELANVYNEKDMELARSGGKQIYEGVVKFTDGSLRNIIFNKALFTDETGNPIGIVGVMTDITDKKESEKLKQSIDEILEQDKMKTEFFSNISHELRTPLNVILGSIQLMELYVRDKEYHNSKEKVTRNTSIMKQNCYRLLRLVNNLIDISKIDAKAFEIHPKNFNIVSIVEDITLSVSDYIENKGIKLIFDTDIEEKTIACDEEKIERIMLNLLSNAIKHTPPGGDILVNVYDKDDSICIKVEDSGDGIPEDKKSQIFQRFCQIDGMFTRLHEGSGIGLNLVKSLVEMHGGTIGFESKVGEGTSFIITLPCNLTCENEMKYSSSVKQAHIERISVEFADIYSIVS